MASLGSSIRSAARATSSAYKRLPIRWRLAGGSAALTLVILCGFAAIVGVLTTQQIQRDFSREVADAADELSREVKLRLRPARRRHAVPDARSAARTSTTTRRQPERRGADHHAQRRLRDGQRGRAELRPLHRAPRERRRLARRVAPRRGARLRRPAGDPVRAAAVRRAGDRQPREGVPGLRRARRRPARAARRPGHRAPRDGADRRADRGRARGRALARPDGADPAPGLRGRGRRAGPHAGVDARGARRGAHGDRGDADAPARVRRRRLARAAHAADLRAGQPRAARGGPRRRAARGRRLRPALLAPDAPAGRRPAAARARRRRPRRRRTSRSTSPRSSPTPPPSSSRWPATTRSPIAAPAGHDRRRAPATSCTG